MPKKLINNRPYKLPLEIERKVKSALVSKGKTLTSVATGKDFTVQAVCRVFKGWRNTRRIRQAIARAAGFRVDEIWPL